VTVLLNKNLKNSQIDTSHTYKVTQDSLILKKKNK